VAKSTWTQPLEQSRQGTGHWHIEGHCALRMGRTWSVKFAGCQADGTDDPREVPVYRSSLPMVRDAIRVRLHNQEA
jgi:hypothetical protein